MTPRKALLDRNSGSTYPAVAPSMAGMAVLMGLLAGAPRCSGADLWGGSLSATSEYLVRGISRSDDRAALQLDLHYLDTSGFLAGVFASNAQIDPGEPRDVEFDAFVGFAWNAGDDWRGRVLATYYAYPWNHVGSRYNYGELKLDVGYRDWLDVAVSYSPDAPYFSRHGYLHSSTAESAEINLQQPIWGKLAGTAGIGYYELDAADAAGYAYFSAGLVYDLAPLSLTVQYVDTTAAAKTLFYNAAAGGRWSGTIIWRF